MDKKKIPPTAGRVRLSTLKLALRNFDENLFVQVTYDGLLFVDEKDNHKGSITFDKETTWSLNPIEQEEGGYVYIGPDADKIELLIRKELEKK